MNSPGEWSFPPHGYLETQVPSSLCSADLLVLKIICMMEARSPSRADSICREEEERMEKAHWDVFCSPDSEVVHFIVTHAIGDNVVTWPQLTARDAGKCSPALSSHVPDYSSLIIEEWFSTNWSSELESSEEPSLFPASLSGWCSLLQTVCSTAAIAAVSYHSAFPIPLLSSGLWTQWVLLCILIAWHLLDNEHILSKSMEDQLLNLQGPVQCRVPFSKRIRILRKRHQELLWQFSG